MSTAETETPVDEREIPDVSQETSAEVGPNDVQMLGQFKEGTISEIKDEAKEAMPKPDLNRSITSIGLNPQAVEASTGIWATFEREKKQIVQLEQSAVSDIGAVGNRPIVETKTKERKTPEQMVEIREKFQSERGKKLLKVFKSDAVSGGLNLVPFVGGGKMLAEAIAGETLSGEKLPDGKSQIIHGAIAIAILAMDISGVTELKLAGNGVKILGSLAVKLGELGLTKAAAIMAKTVELMMRHPQLTAKAEQAIEAKIRVAMSQVKDYRNQSV